MARARRCQPPRRLGWPELLCAALLPLAATSLRADEDLFERQIRPVLVETCLPCHGGKETEGALRVDSRDALLKGGDRGAAIVPGKAGESLLVQAVRRTHDEVAMPPAKKLPEGTVAAFGRWVDAGARWPDKVVLSESALARQRNYWSFQPLRKPAVPDVQNGEWPATPIDDFVLAKLAENGLAPAAAAKQTLLRRATFDLTGLPPTPEEVQGFLADESPDAFPRVVDRLLASPAFGERWGRHWLDVVRYSDSAGNAPDFPVPQAHKYRDYVIRSIGHDKPFDQFVREQIAGDLLPSAGDSQRQEQIIATGYLAIGRRYFGTKAGPDHLEVEELIGTLGTSLLGLSIGCARCHDHKFDPVSQREYYALYGIFSSTRFPQPGAEGNAKQENFVPLPDGSDAYAVTDSTPANAKVQRGGEPGSLGDEVPRGFLQILGGQSLPADASGSGRLELAQWLTDPAANPLLPRVAANRLWQHYFGTGLVSTPSDFGLRGEPPTQPELLDHLASELIAKDWSMQSLHRRIVLSRVYQLSSTTEGGDDESGLLRSHARRRLDAESIRDAILAASGMLDRSIPGPHPFPPKEQWNFSQHAPFVAVYDSSHRSVYLMQQRIKKHPFLALFDGADTNAGTASRLPTTTPLQSLFWMNDPWVHEQSERFAERLLRECGDDSERLDRAFLLLFARPPRTGERQASLAHLARVRASVRESGITLDAEEARLSWSSLARVLFSSNEFLYVD